MSIIKKAVYKIEEYLVLISILGMLLVVVWNIICRSILHIEFLIGDELARYLMIYGVFLGIAVGVRKGSHVGIRALVEVLPPALRKNVDVVQTIITTIVYIAAAIISFLTAKHFGDMGQVSTMMRIPMSAVYAILPIGFILSAIHSIENLVTIIKNKPALTEKEKAERGEVEI